MVDFTKQIKSYSLQNIFGLTTLKTFRHIKNRIIVHSIMYCGYQDKHFVVNVI